MITEQQQERASLYVLGALTPAEHSEFEAEVRGDGELRVLVLELQRAANLLAQSVPSAAPPVELRSKVLLRIGEMAGAKGKPALAGIAGLHFQQSVTESGWKKLPVPGAFIKLLSLEKERGYAVLLGKIEAGARYPAHENAGPEDFYILSGDLVVGSHKMCAGDFHHADGGSKHEVNYSVGGCTLLAVLTTDDPLVALAMA